ncbi:MAG: ABC transporter permease [bacterium]
MLNYIVRRLLLMFPTLLGITLVVFTVMALSPGGISAQSLVDGFGMKPQEKQALQEYYDRRYGLNDPAPLQYLRWLNNISPVGFVQDEDGNFSSFSLSKGSQLGESIRYGRPVSDLLAERVPITLLLNVLSIPVIYIISIMVGVRAALERGGSFDVTSSALMLGLWSIPTMLTGVLLIGFFSSDQFWHWFPTSGLNDPTALAMPFLPHWSSLADVAVLFVGLLGGTWLGLMWGRLSNREIRIVGSLVLAVGLASWMLNDLPFSPGLAVTAAVGLVSVVTIMSLAATEYVAMRVGFFTCLGALAGALLAASFFQGEFVRGFLLDRLWHLVLPVFCLSYGGFAFLARLTRSSMLENLQADYARTARAKGVAEKDVIWNHVFRNSLLPLITVSASLLPSLLAGSVIVESIFSIDGMGKLAVEAVKGRDRELVLSITFISGLLTLLSYLLADILYAIVDPRVSYE